MAEDCIFCRIARHDADASIVREDDKTVAFLDISQSGAGGHVLIIPRLHVEDVYALDDETAAALMRSIIEVARAVRTAFTPDGLNIFQSNGEAAGQEVPHVHFHVQPRWHGDGVLNRYTDAAHPPRAALDEMARRIKAAL